MTKKEYEIVEYKLNQLKQEFIEKIEDIKNEIVAELDIDLVEDKF